MTTQITNPTDDSVPTIPAFADRDRRSGRAPMMFSPTSYAEMGQFDTEADLQ